MDRKIFFENLNQSFADELPAGHEQRFEKRLQPDSEKKWFLRSELKWIVSLAASILLLFFFGFQKIHHKTESAQKTEYAEIQEATNYMEGEIRFRLSKLNGYPDALISVQKDIRDIDETAELLENEIKRNPGDERLVNAMVQTYQAKLTLLQMVIDQQDNRNKI